MWKKPSIEKPDFKKFELNEMSENEAFEISGGSTIIETVMRPFPPPLTGMVAIPFDINRPVFTKGPDIIKITDIDKITDIVKTIKL